MSERDFNKSQNRENPIQKPASSQRRNEDEQDRTNSTMNNTDSAPENNDENQSEILSQADFEAALARLVATSETDFQTTATSICIDDCECEEDPDPP